MQTFPTTLKRWELLTQWSMAFAITCCLLLNPLMLSAQDCQSYRCAMDKATLALQNKDYPEAFRRMESAIGFPDHDPIALGDFRQELFGAILSDKNNAEAQLRLANGGQYEKILAANRDLVEPLKEVFDSYMDILDYKGAGTFLGKAAGIDSQLGYAGRETFTHAYMQLIYYHTLCGWENKVANQKAHLAQALSLSDELHLYQSKPAAPPAGDTLALLQSLLADYPKLQQLRNLYLPRMIAVDGGTFAMFPEYQVSLSGYEIGETEVTVRQYLLFCEAGGYAKPEPPNWGFHADHPIVNVSWGDAAAYCNWLTRQNNRENKRGDAPLYSIESRVDWNRSLLEERVSDIQSLFHTNSKGFRLPTEAEWQYAAAGGAKGISGPHTYAGSDDLATVGWYAGNSRTRTEPVATKNKNVLGIYDMSGNAQEWCQDWFAASLTGTVFDPQMDQKDLYRVIRGGSWGSDMKLCRVDHRNDNFFPGYLSDTSGFRVARTR